MPQNPGQGIFVVAHRGRHNPAPMRHLGVDMMALDVRRTRDGVLVIVHDETVG
jgi:glycerophosphoryl diester phosphodiesterase